MMCVMPTLAASQPLVITAPAAPGGGWDQTARAMQRVLTTLEPALNVQVDNIPGAAGTIGLARFIQSERGNPQALMVTGLVMVSGAIMNGSPVSLANTTPIARLTGEYEVIVVPAASRFQSMRDLVEAFRADPGSISWGGGSAGGTDDMLVRLLAEQVGLPSSRVNYIAFAGGGAALAAVLGGQLSAAVSGHAEFAGQIAAGQLRVLAVSAPSRVRGIEAPTLRDAGIDLDLANWRAIVAPPGLSISEQEALTTLIARMSASAEWRQVLIQNGWEDLFLAGAPFRQFLLAEQSRIEDVLRRLASNDRRPAGVRLSPVTVPYIAAAALAGLALVVVFRRPRIEPIDPRALALVSLGLLSLPLIVGTLGFIAAAAGVFVLTATALREGRRGVTVSDVVAATTFAVAVFLLFTRVLGVTLPGPQVF